MTLSLDAGVVSPAPAATVRTRVSVPLRFPDGYATTADVVTFDGLADGREHLLLGLGDWRGALERSAAGGTSSQSEGYRHFVVQGGSGDREVRLRRHLVTDQAGLARQRAGKDPLTRCQFRGAVDSYMRS